MWKLNGIKITPSYNRLEKNACSSFTKPVEVFNAVNSSVPLILASPHSGREYPAEFQSLTTLSLAQLRLGEDAFVDQIIEPCIAHGIQVVHARFPRCFVDVNRGPDEIPPEYMGAGKLKPSLSSARARAGLGVVPKRIAQNQDIYAHTLTSRQIKNRLDHFYHPYHAQIKNMIINAKQTFGQALLIDCHSMPGRGPNGEKRPDIILGDRYGKSCHTETTRQIEAIFQSLGYSVSRNYPYAGGYITEHYGQPDRSIETLQIEINKDLYLNPVNLQPHEGMRSLRANFEQLILRLVTDLFPAADIAAQ